MSRVLILYGTTDGHTRLIAEAIGDTLRLSGVAADVVRAGSADPSPAAYSGVIVAASIQAGGYQKTVQHWVRAHARELDELPTALVSACLSIVNPSPALMADLESIVTRFVKTTGWRPARIKHVAGALLYTRYNFLKRWVMKRIAASHGGATDTRSSGATFARPRDRHRPSTGGSMPAPDVILETTRALANDWRSLAFGWHLLFGLVALFALAGWRPRPVQLAALVLLPFVSVMTLAWTAGNTFTAFAFLLATIALIAAAASLGEHAAAPGSRVEVFAGAMLIGLGWCYPHFLDGASWTRYLYEAPLGVVPCATLSFAAGVSLVAGGLGSRAWSWLLGAMAAYYGVVGVFVLGVVIDAALVAGAIMLAINASRRRTLASVSRDAIAASVAVTILASVTAPASAQSVPESDAVKTFVEATTSYARMHRRLEGETGQIQINSTAESIATAVDALAQAIGSERATARQGDFFRPDLARELRVRIDDALADRGLTASDVRLDQVDGLEAAPVPLRVNATFSWALAAAPMTPCVIAALPPLPPELQYRFVADNLVLIDVHASLIVDVMPNALAGVTTRDF